MNQAMEVTLYQNVHCPFSERARRALGEKGIFQNRHEIHWHEFDALKGQTGEEQIPTLVYEDTVVSGSGAIARWANSAVEGGVDLFPGSLEAAIARWEKLADVLNEKTMPLVIPVWADVMTDATERDAFLARYTRYGDYKQLRNNRLDLWREVEAEWRKLDAELEGQDYLLGRMTYADYAVYGAVWLAAQFHAYDIPQAHLQLASWWEALRTQGLMRDQEVLLGKSRQGHANHDIDYTRSTTRYGDPPHDPAQSNDQTY